MITGCQSSRRVTVAACAGENSTAPSYRFVGKRCGASGGASGCGLYRTVAVRSGTSTEAATARCGGGLCVGTGTAKQGVLLNIDNGVSVLSWRTLT